MNDWFISLTLVSCICRQFCPQSGEQQDHLERQEPRAARAGSPKVLAWFVIFLFCSTKEENCTDCIRNLMVGGVCLDTVMGRINVPFLRVKWKYI